MKQKNASRSSQKGDSADSKVLPAPGKPQRDTALGGDLAAGLYVTATPIGHARDVSLRALEVLAGVDLIACEDTRVTAKLLAIHNISRPLTAYNDHNAERERPRLLGKLKRGARIALVSDAGTPLVSDPGTRETAYATLGRLYSQVGDYAKARASFQGALRIDPQRSDAKDWTISPGDSSERIVTQEIVRIR